MERSSDSRNAPKATRIDGARFLEDVVNRLRREIAAAGNPQVCLVTILVSDDPRDLSNARRKHVEAEKAGMQWRHVQLRAVASQRDVERAIKERASDPHAHGIFVQLPLPPSLDARVILECIPPRKDVDGHPPATPRGIVRLLEYGGVRLGGARAVVVGSSSEIAIPVARLLSERRSHVALVDANAQELVALTRDADVLISTAERPRLITAAHVKPGATVVDAGYNRTGDGVVGDVDLESVELVAGKIVPMPGGTGPATIACLLERTWEAAR